MQRFEKRLQHDKFAWVRAEIERQYIRLTKIGVCSGAKTSLYRGARGSGNNNKRRAASMAHMHTMVVVLAFNLKELDHDCIQPNRICRCQSQASDGGTSSIHARSNQTVLVMSKRKCPCRGHY